MGNYLRSEILFDAGISPYRKVGSLSKSELESLAKSAIGITALAYHEKGVTVPQELYQTLRENGLSRYQARHYVFTRDGLECHNCQSLIVHTRLSNRRLDYCPKCQIYSTKLFTIHLALELRFIKNAYIDQKITISQECPYRSKNVSVALLVP